MQARTPLLPVEPGQEVSVEIGNSKTYDADEIAFAQSLYRFDFAFLPVFAVWYFALAWCMGPASAAAPERTPPTCVLLLQAALAIGSALVLGVEIHMPAPKKEDDIYHAVRYGGWWVTLTRHCLTFQVVHFVVSFIGAVAGLRWFVQRTNKMTFFIGSGGWFVTVQYFLLVHNNPAFVAKCKRVAKEKPLLELGPRTLSTLIHSPALIFAVLDVTLAKDRAAVARDCSKLLSLAMCVFYCLFYVLLVQINRCATGYYPYGVLAELKTLKKWVVFVIVQAVTFSIFCVLECGLANFVPATW